MSPSDLPKVMQMEMVDTGLEARFPGYWAIAACVHLRRPWQEAGRHARTSATLYQLWITQQWY